jgi:hypothetical protein
MKTVDGRAISVIDPGKLNSDAGPDFFNAKIRIGDSTWAGDVEIHVKASDWMRHGHHLDRAYDSVILHVVGKDDMAITLTNGTLIPQMKMECNPNFNKSYEMLVGAAASTLPCTATIAEIPRLHLLSWLDNLAFERIYDKTGRIKGYLERYAGDWEATCYVTLARALGFGTNSEPFERLAMSLPLQFIGKHSDSSLSIEALLFGQAGLLDDAVNPEGDVYIDLLKREYAFLAHKFSLQKPQSLGWKMARMRPANFPHRRIAFLAAMLFGGFKLMSRILQVGSVEDARRLFEVELSGFWTTHYNFSQAAMEEQRASALGASSVASLIINVVVPLMHAYGSEIDNNEVTERAVGLLQQLRPESNSVVSLFTSAGIECKDAFTSQALIQLRRQYCEPRKCLFCRIGHRMLSQHTKSTAACCQNQKQ